MSHEQLVAPELAAIDVQGISRQSFIMRGAVAAGAVYGLGAVGPFVREAMAQEGGGDVDDSQLRAHAGVPRGRVLQPGAEARGRPLGRRQVAGHRDPRQRGRARRRAGQDHQEPRRHARQGAGGGLRGRVREPEVVPQARADVRGHRRERLQRRRPGDRVRRGAGGGRQHRAGRGPPRRGDPVCSTASPSATAASTSRSRCRPCWTPSSRSSSPNGEESTCCPESDPWS